VTAPLVGPRTVEQFTDALGALDVTLPADALSRLDELFPGPGVAPEAYTW
jgi:aryl-alcohol dehydrogenase-like predicted oxidoreductase